jgi:hypothetical protein
MKKLIVVILLSAILYACNSGDSEKSAQPSTVVYDAEEEGDKIPTPGGEGPAYDPNRGAGKFTNVSVGNKLDAALANKGEKIYGVKCAVCFHGKIWKYRHPDFCIRHYFK